MLDMLRKYRRDLHRIPECGDELPLTLAYIRSALSGLSCELIVPANGSLCAWFDAGKPETLAFRADTDALPIAEMTNAEYASVHAGRMHACGHDGHTAMLLGLSHILERDIKTLPHNVLLIFQCAEETTGGAEQIVKSSILDEKNVKYVFGSHLWPGLPFGAYAARPGAMMARSSEVTVDIAGRSAHVARAGDGADALLAAVEFIRLAYASSDALHGAEAHLLRFGKLQSGNVRNAISASSHIEGTLRSFSNVTHEALIGMLHDVCAKACQAHDCKGSVGCSAGYPPLCNDASLYERVCALLGDEAPAPLAEPSMTAEDFSFYAEAKPSLFFFLGTGDTAPLHSAAFDFDERCLCKGLELYERLLYIS